MKPTSKQHPFGAVRKDGEWQCTKGTVTLKAKTISGLNELVRKMGWVR